MKTPLRLLYAEDNPQDADLTRAHFAEHAPEFELVIVPTGVNCLAQVQLTPPDLLLLDHHLPDMEGIDVYMALVQIGVGVPVVLVTGEGNEELVVIAMRLGVANCVAKRGNYLDTLPALLIEVLKQHQRERAQALPPEPRRILFVEHLPVDLDLSLRHFAKAAPHFTLDVVRSGAEALARMARSPAYDLALIDLRLPDMSGLDLVREAQAGHLRLPPHIMIAGAGDEEAALASMQLGATDYIIKRDGYLSQLTYRIDFAIAHEQLRAEVTAHQATEANLRIHQVELEQQNEELRRAHFELTTAQARSLDLFDFAPAGLCTVNAQGLIMEANLTLATQLGVARGRLIKQPLSRFIAKEDTDQFHLLRQQQPAAQSAVATHSHLDPDSGEPAGPDRALQHCELRMRRSDGSQFWDHLATSLVTGEDGRADLRVVLTDITARKAVEEERAKLQAQFNQAQKMEVIGQLAGGVAHDFNNILTAMMLNLELLRTALQLPEASSPLQDLQAMTKRAAGLTKQLLMFARRQTIQVTTIELNGAVVSVLKMLQHLLGEQVILKFVPGAPSLWVEGDAGMLDQVVMNLCINARDAMPAGGTLTLATRRVEFGPETAKTVPDFRPGSFVCLTVSDTGGGMPPDVLQHVFEPFFTTKEIGKGSGLGLAAVHGIVHQHQGWVNVVSALGQGTTFQVYLPSSTKSSPHEQVLPVAEQRKGGSETILMVEDEVVVRKVATVMLQQLGYRVLATADSQEALRLWDEQADAIDLLFSDMVLPSGMTGLQLGQKLQKTKPTLKIVLMSGYNAEIIRGEMKLSADIAFLPKPFEFKTLADTIRRSLEGGLATRVCGSNIDRNLKPTLFSVSENQL
jgi:signal transduction histidine kinase